MKDCRLIDDIRMNKLERGQSDFEVLLQDMEKSLLESLRLSINKLMLDVTDLVQRHKKTVHLVWDEDDFVPVQWEEEEEEGEEPGDSRENPICVNSDDSW